MKINSDLWFIVDLEPLSIRCIFKLITINSHLFIFFFLQVNMIFNYVVTIYSVSLMGKNFVNKNIFVNHYFICDYIEVLLMIHRQFINSNALKIEKKRTINHKKWNLLRLNEPSIAIYKISAKSKTYSNHIESSNV